MCNAHIPYTSWTEQAKGGPNIHLHEMGGALQLSKKTHTHTQEKQTQKLKLNKTI